MKKNFIPDIVNPSPDYYCTWQTQLYITNDGGPEAQRENITEENMFGTGAGQGWTDFYENARKDLFFIMDDSWDVPLKDYDEYYGSLVLNSEKFPSFCKDTDNQNALKKLVDAVKAKGWKGLGGWVCGQESPLFCENISQEEYWKKRVKEADFSGFAYWKVDWGKISGNPDFRKLLTSLARKYAPNLTVEHAIIPEMIPFSDTYRTYDVPAIMSIPMTMEKLASCLMYECEEGFGGLLNCEDEVYVAAALGCTMGIMRHPMQGAFLNGEPDLSFPQMHRNLKTKITEITRAVNWHKIAPAFAVSGKNTKVSDKILTDMWEVADQKSEIEAWWNFKNGDVIKKNGPSAIARNTYLPEVVCDSEESLPFVCAAKNPSGAYSVATLGRTKNREYIIPDADITVNIENADTVGVFGYYKKLILDTSYDVSDKHIYAQDLASDEAIDITERVNPTGKTLVIDGKIISEIGTSAQPEGDTSEPGLLIKII